MVNELHVFLTGFILCLKQRSCYTLFYISKTFISNTRLKLAKNQIKAKKHPEAELVLFENYSLSSSKLSSKNNRSSSKKCIKDKCTCFNEILWLMAMKQMLKMKSRQHR